MPGLQVELGGQVFAEFEPPSSEVLGLAFAIIILILAFGSVLAMGLPIGTALAGIIVGSIIAGLLSNLLSMPDFASIIGIMIGLGVGIDYALFIVTRYRENVHHGASGETATAVAIDTAGRAVVFAGITVVISLLGMLVMGVAFVSGLAIGAAVVVAMTAVASITLLPALLGFAGSRVELTRWRGLIAAGLVAVGAPRRRPQVARADPAAAWRWPSSCSSPSFVLRPAAAGGPEAGAQAAAARPSPTGGAGSSSTTRGRRRSPARSSSSCWPCPFLGLRLGFSDEGNYAEDTTTRKAYDLLAEGFGPGFNGPLILATEMPAGHRSGHARRGQPRPSPRPRASPSPSPAQVNEAGTAALWFVVPTTAPQDEATTELVNRLRDDVLPGRRPRAPGSTSRSPAPWPSTSTSPSTSAPACPTSSASCSACRSCC